MEEVYAVGRVEATNRAAAYEKTERLALAFEALGGEARPLLPKLKDEFNGGRSIGACVAAFRYIGGNRLRPDTRFSAHKCGPNYPQRMCERAIRFCN